MFNMAPDETFERIAPDPEMLLLLVEVMGQNNVILEMNKLITKVIVSTPMIIKTEPRPKND